MLGRMPRNHRPGALGVACAVDQRKALLVQHAELAHQPLQPGAVAGGGDRHALSRINRHVFNLQGQAAFKRRFHGEEEATYIASRKATPLKAMALLRLCRAV